MQILDAYGLQEGDLVILDSLQRVIEGAENDADTMRGFYRHTGAMLKRRRLTVVRTDNTGKDATRGARGSVAKRDDVDIEYQHEVKRDDLILKAAKARILGVSDRKNRRHFGGDGSLAFLSVSDQVADDAVGNLCRDLDRLGVPASAGEPTVEKALTAAKNPHTLHREYTRKVRRVAIKRRQTRAVA